MISKLQDIIKQYDNLMIKMSSPNIMSNISEYKKLAREEKSLSIIIPKICLSKSELKNFLIFFKIKSEIKKITGIDITILIILLIISKFPLEFTL